MRVLLDTHAVLWAMTQPSLLPDSVQVLLLDDSTETLVSATVAWELSIKHRSGKLPEAAPLLADFSAVTTSLGATILPIEISHAILAGALDWEHRDPFDRMLAAQAMLAGAVLISRDKAFDAVPGLRLSW